MKRALVRAHGSDPISYSTLQEGLSYFETSFGYVAYQRAFGFDLTLGPPVCAERDRPELIRRFLAASKRPIFFYLPRDVADLAAELGGRRFGLSGMGVDKVVPLAGAEVPPHSRVRGALKKANRVRLEVVEVAAAELTSAQRHRLDAITRSYLRRSAVPVEMRFLNRPFSVADDGLARTFVLRQGEDAQVFGYAVLDPYFEEGRVRGYLLNLIRFERTRLWGVYYSAVAMLAAQLRREGVAELSLGFCPLVGVESDGCSPGLSRQVKWMEAKLAGVEYVARLRELKEAFAGPTPQRYFVSSTPFAAVTLLALLRACRVPLTEIVRRTLRG